MAKAHHGVQTVGKERPIAKYIMPSVIVGAHPAVCIRRVTVCTFICFFAQILYITTCLATTPEINS